MPSLVQRLNAGSTALATSTTHAFTRMLQTLHLRAPVPSPKESASSFFCAEQLSGSRVSEIEGELATPSSAHIWRPTKPSSKIPLRLLQRARSSQLLNQSNLMRMPVRANASHVDVRVSNQDENQSMSWPHLSDHPYASPLLPVEIDTSVCDFDTIMRIPDEPWPVSEQLRIGEQHSPNTANEPTMGTKTPSLSTSPVISDSPAHSHTPPDSPPPTTPRIGLGLEEGIVVSMRTRFASLPTHILDDSSGGASTLRTPSAAEVESKKSIARRHKATSSLDANREGLLCALGLPLGPEPVSRSSLVPLPVVPIAPLAHHLTSTGSKGGRADQRSSHGGSLAVHQRRRASTHPPLKILTQSISPEIQGNVSMTDLRIRRAARTYPLPPQKAVPDYPPPPPPIPALSPIPASPTMSTSSYYTAHEAMFESYVGGQHELSILPAWVSSPRTSIELARATGDTIATSVSSSLTLSGEARGCELKVSFEEADDPAAILLDELKRHDSPSSQSDATVRGRGRHASLPDIIADRKFVERDTSFNTDTGVDVSFASARGQSTTHNTPTKKQMAHGRDGGAGSMDFGMLLSESFNERSRRASSLGFAYDASSLSAADESASAASNATILAACTEPLHQHPFALA